MATSKAGGMVVSCASKPCRAWCHMSRELHALHQRLVCAKWRLELEGARAGSAQGPASASWRRGWECARASWWPQDPARTARQGVQGLDDIAPPL